MGCASHRHPHRPLSCTRSRCRGNPGTAWSIPGLPWFPQIIPPLQGWRGCMGRLRGRGLGGLCSSAQGAPTWASTAHGGHSRDGPTVAVYGGTDTGVTQQPHVGAQAELSRAPRRGLSAADSEVWVGTVCVPQGGPVHCHTHTAPRSPAPRPLCRERDFAPIHSPASRW